MSLRPNIYQILIFSIENPLNNYLMSLGPNMYWHFDHFQLIVNYIMTWWASDHMYNTFDHFSIKNQLKNDLMNPIPEICSILIDFSSWARDVNFIKTIGPQMPFPFLKSIKKKSLSSIRSTRDTVRSFLSIENQLKNELMSPRQEIYQI